MASKATSAKLLKLLFNLCFAVLFFEAIAVAEWILAMTMMPKSPMAHLMPLAAVLLGVQVIALVFYFFKPWITVVLAWMGVFIIAARAIPWGTPSWLSSMRQFQFQIVFLVAAHAGAWLYVRLRRAEAGIVAEMVSGGSQLPAVENEVAESAESQTPSS